MKKKISCIFIFIMITIFSIYKISDISSEIKIKNSSIYKVANEYYTTNNINKNYNFSKAENSFLEGLEYYNSKDFEKAKLSFEESKKLDEYNPTISFYSNFYLNQCEKEISGQGDFFLIEKTLKTMKKYSVFSNETQMIWQMVSSVSFSSDSRRKMAELLENYIKDAHKLTLESELKIKVFTAIIKMTNEEYGKSIYLYYDVIYQSQKIKDEDLRSKFQIKSYEYLGNIYFILEEYDLAVSYYNKAISIPVKDFEKNAISKYGSYVNRTESFIEMKNYKKAEESSLETEKIISYLPDDIAIGVKVFRYKNLLLLESRKNNFKKAEEYYKLSLKYLAEEKREAFLNAIMYIELAHSEMLYLEKRYDEAIQKLNFLLKKDLEERWGFDNYIYTLLSKIYRETGQIEKYLEAEKNINKIEEEFNKNLKQDYIKFVKNRYVLDQLKNQEKVLRLKITGLAGAIFIAFICIILSIKKIKKLDETNYIDSLTNIYNRKYMEYLSKQNLKYPEKVAVVMIDIDYFKDYNDFYGHPAGDFVIKKIAEIIKNNIRKGDVLIRYGGEEFLLILRNTDFDIFNEIYKRITENLYKENISHQKSKVSDRVTLSFGVYFEHFKENLNLEKSIKKADEALYSSKKNGRNRFTRKN